MRSDDKAALGLAAAALIALMIYALFATLANSRLAASVQRFEQVKAANAKEIESRTGNTSPTLEPVPADTPARPIKTESPNWKVVFDHVAVWLKSIEYPSDRLLFPSELKNLGDETIPPLPPAPEELIEETRAAVRVNTIPFATSSGPMVSNLAVLLAGGAQRDLAAGDQASAVGKLLDAMRVADLIWDRPQYEQLRVYGALEEVIRDEELSLEIAKPLLAHLSSAKDRVDIHEMLINDLQERLTDVKAWKSEAYSNHVGSSGLYWGTLEWMWVRPPFEPFFENDQQARIDMTLRLVELAEKQPSEARPAMDELETALKASPFWNSQESSELQMRFDALIANRDWLARLDIMRLGIALNAYYAREGRFAESLDAVYGDLGGAPPVDPYTGIAYHYDVRRRGFIVFSEGRKNDGAGAAWGFWLPPAQQ